MRKVLLFVFVLLACSAKGQDFEGDAMRIVDTLLQRWQTDSVFANQIPDDRLYFMKMQDSLVRAFVVAHVASTIADGYYSWPGWYFENQQFQHLTDKKHTGSVYSYPSKTEQYLLQHKYRVLMSGVSNGCLAQKSYVLHDSLMNYEICKLYGEDFFTRTCEEAKKLDKKGRGLILPYIIGKKTAASLKSLYTIADTLDRASGFFESGQRPYLVIEFVAGQVARAYWGERNWGGVQFSPTLFKPKEKLEERVRVLHWHPPTFNGKPADETVYFNYKEGMLEFL